MGRSHRPTFLVFIYIHVISICFASNLFDIPSDQQQPQNQGFVCKQNRQERSITDNDTESSTSRKLPRKKWQVGRVSRKQYEIVNMLWRRTKDSFDVKSTTFSKSLVDNNSGRQETTNVDKPILVTRAIQQSSTPSFIEFYYFDENDDPMKHKNFSIDKTENILSHRKPINFEKEGPQMHPLISFHMNDPITTRIPYPIKPFNLNPNNLNRNHGRKSHDFLLDVLMQSRNSTRFGYVLKPLRLVDLFNNRTWFGKKLVTVKVYLNGSRVMQTKQTLKPSAAQSLRLSSEVSAARTSVSGSPTITSSTRMESTIASDRIKFFEMYDRNTLAPSLQKAKTILRNDDYEKSIQAKDQKIDLENVDQNIGHYNSINKQRYKKKHVSYDSFTTLNQKLPTLSEGKTESVSRLSVQQTYTPNVANMSKSVSWSSYPFVAVYVYKPTETHCDAAGISPHWLLAAGSCLSRRKLVHSIQARSAYVAYCGESWRRPERIAYVKYSLVHPNFHPQDTIRRLNYNIGLIQVSTSMESACPNWVPIPLMSHQFAAYHEGSMVSALGWGLDRYGTRYTEKLPHTPLMLYEGLVYSDICPGSIAYSKAKRQEDGSGANNIFCLLLPPYSGEEQDPVHGGLLLDGGKLIALYLQEERRRWGAQSAQYTGVWRLIPWMLEVAREPEDPDTIFTEL